MTLETRLEPAQGSEWRIVEGDEVLSAFDSAKIRPSVSWKAMVFRDAEEARVYDEKRDLLSIDQVWQTFEDDLVSRGNEAKRPADPVNDEDWMRTLSEAYIEEPVAS
jgi:hypothetical protein